MSLTYTTLVSSLQNLLQQEDAGNNSPFTNILPEIIDDAEQRIYRELNLLTQQQENTSVSFAAGSRVLSLSSTSLPCMVVQQVAAFTPYGSSPPNATRVLFEGPVSLDFINTMWPSAYSTLTPGTIQGYWAMQDPQTVVVAPTPDSSYIAGVTGIFRPLPMSATNQTTYLGTYYPDLFLAACMIFASAWERDWGSQSDDPKLAQSWENHYTLLKQSAIEEEARRRGESVGWTPMKQYIATPPRT